MHAAVHRSWIRWKHPRVLRNLEEAERTQWLSADELRQRQWNDVQKIVRTAYTKVPFYAEWFRSVGATPEDLTSPDSFARLPVLRKETIRARLEEMRDRSVRDAYVNHTGGSTGHPLSFYQDPGYKDWNDAFTIRFDRWAGWDFGSRTAILWGAERDLEALQRSVRGRLVTDFVLRETYLNAFRLDERRIAEFADTISRVRPTTLRGYVSALTALAQAIERGTVRWSTQLRSIISAAETLSDDQRQRLERVFGCPVFNRYASRDVGMIAAECEAHEGLHIATDNVMLEFLPLGAGAEQEIIVTTLRNGAMPLIRYAIEDVGIPSPGTTCTCGRGFPRLKAVKGRISDVIMLPGSRSVHGEYFTHLFYGVPGVRQFQVIQESIEELRILVATEKGYDPTCESRLTSEIAGFLQTDLRIRFERVTEIPLTATGKHRFTISKVTGATGAR